MNVRRKFKPIAILLSVWMGLYPLHSAAMDIDIFTGASAGASDNPNILIVLDNTSNWSRQSQQWPGGLAQGQSEVHAIKTVLNAMNLSNVNVGLFEYQTDGNAAADDSGKVRYAVSQMTSANKTTLSGILDAIYGNINGTAEKRNTGPSYGNLFYDVYNYLAGANASSTGGVNSSSLVDSNGYTNPYSTFKTPLSASHGCAKTYVIFVTNPDARGPTADSSADLTTLSSLGGNTAQLGLPSFSSVTQNVTTAVGTTNTCYATQAACTTDQATSGTAVASSCTDGTYSAGCACTTTVTDTSTACASGTQRYSVIGTINAGSTNLGYTSACYSNTSSCTTSDYATQCTGTGISCACNSGTYTTTGCTGSKKKFMVVKTQSNTTTTNLGYTSSCYASTTACATTDYSTACASYNSCACGTPTTTSSSCAVGNNKYTVAGTNAVTTNTPTGGSVIDTATYNLDEWARFLFQQGVPVTGTTTRQNVATYTIDVYNAQPNATHTSLMLSTAKAGGGKYFSATNEAAITSALTQIFAEILSANSTFASASLPVSATNRAQDQNEVFIGMFRPDPGAQPRWFGNLKRYQLILAADGITVELGDKNGASAVNNQTGFLSDCAVSYWTADSGTFWQNYPINPSPAGKCATAAPGGGAYNDNNHMWSDYPDGPEVEKGAVAQVLRQGNNPPLTGGASAAGLVNRHVYSTDVSAFSTNNPTAGNTLSPISNLATLADGSPSVKSWVQGYDALDENGNAVTVPTTSPSSPGETRASIHGDVVHSRPLPVTYGASGNNVIYYGANDGQLRAVDSETGQEKWSFLPYEFTTARTAYASAKYDGTASSGPVSLNSTYDPQQRLMNDSPLVDYAGVLPLANASPAAIDKDFYWDGSIGLYQVWPSNCNNCSPSKTWIYPTMRRGGRMIYAMDVSSPSALPPAVKWKVGCPSLDLTNGNGCIGVPNIGQTWSTPNIAPVKGYATSFVAFVGGGYDTCEDADSSAPSCGSPKGAAVYAFDAESGTLLSALPTTRSVPSDVALVDIDGDGNADYGYVLDAGGSLYRISMVSRSVDTFGNATYTPLGPGAWTITRVAYTSGAGRKFLYAPALVSTGANIGKIYVAMGSGDREHPLYSNYTSSVTNRFYVFLDDLSSNSTTNLDDGAAMNDYTTDQGCDVNNSNHTLVLPSSGKKGWFMNLNANGAGEQTVTSALVSAGQITFSTNQAIAPASGTCSNPLGVARGYWINLLNASGAIGVTGNCGGSRSNTFSGGGLPPSPVSGTVLVAGKPTSVVIGATQKESGASAPIQAQRITPTMTSSRARVYNYTTGDNQ